MEEEKLDCLPMDRVDTVEPFRRPPVRTKPSFVKSPFGRNPELVGRTIEEMVAPNDPVRIVKRLACLISMESLYRDLKLIGGPCYEPRRLMALWIFALWDGVRSSRQIEKHCLFDVRYMYLMDGLTPDHTTICRFRRSLGDDMDKLIAETIEFGIHENLVDFGTATLDGTKLPSASSQWRKYRVEASEADGDPEESPKDPGNGDSGCHSSDPEAAVQRLTLGGFAYGYNGQALVDAKSGMTLATHVSNCASDAAELIPVIDKCLELYEILPDKLACDGGYDSATNAEALALSGVEAWIPGKDEKWSWKGDEEGNPVCPAGKQPSCSCSFVRPSGVHVTRLEVEGCKTCLLLETCKKSGRRTISFPSHVDIKYHVMLRDRYRECESTAKEMRLTRAQTSELLFAVIKDRFKLRRLLLRGVDGAKIEFALAALAQNFWILARNLGKALLNCLKRLLLDLFKVVLSTFSIQTSKLARC
jgi:transposase